MYVHAGQPSGKATASLICGILFFIFPLPILAIVFGHIALSEIKKSGGRLIGEGRAIAGLVLGYLGIFMVVPITLIIAAIAIPNLLRARIAANEASAVGSVRTINIAEISYSSAYPKVGFTCSLSDLGGDTHNASSTAAGLIDNQLASGQKSGYRFDINGCTVENEVVTSFRVLATPTQRNTTGARTFCSDQSGVIKSIRAGGDCFEDGTPLN